MTLTDAENALIEKPKALLQPSFSLVFFSIFLKFTKYIDYFQNKFLKIRLCQNFSQHLLFMTSMTRTITTVFFRIFQMFKVYKV